MWPGEQWCGPPNEMMEMHGFGISIIALDEQGRTADQTDNRQRAALTKNCRNPATDGS